MDPKVAEMLKPPVFEGCTEEEFDAEILRMAAERSRVRQEREAELRASSTEPQR